MNPYEAISLVFVPDLDDEIQEPRQRKKSSSQAPVKRGLSQPWPLPNLHEPGDLEATTLEGCGFTPGTSQGPSILNGKGFEGGALLKGSWGTDVTLLAASCLVSILVVFCDRFAQSTFSEFKSSNLSGTVNTVMTVNMPQQVAQKVFLSLSCFVKCPKLM